MKNTLFVFCLLVLFACASQEQQNLPARNIFQTAMEYAADDNNVLAKQFFERLLIQYPWDVHAEQAHLELIRLHVRANQFAEAFVLIDETEQLYPNSLHKDYLLYARGYAYYLDNKATLEDYIFTDISQRSVDSARLSFEIFNQLLLLYPQSKYVPDARQRMVHLRNLFAEKEIDIARFYFNDGAYLACIERASGVLRDYVSTPAIKDAVVLLEECAQRAGVPSFVANAKTFKQQLVQ